MVLPAMIGNAAAQLGGNLIAGYYADKAAEKQAKAAENALNFKKMVWNDAKQQYEPYIAAGREGLTGYQSAIEGYTKPTFGYTQKEFDFNTATDPGYQFRIQEAQKAINAAAAKGGYNLSPGVSKALQTRGQDMASQEYSNSFDRWLKESNLKYGQASDQYNRDIGFADKNIQNYGNLTNLGQNAIAGTTAASQGIGDSMLQVGQAQAFGDTSKANMWTNTAQMLGKGYSDYLLEQEKQNKAKP